MSCVHVPVAWCQGRTLDDDSRFMKHCRGVNGTHKVLKETASPSDNQASDKGEQRHAGRSQKRSVGPPRTSARMGQEMRRLLALTVVAVLTLPLAAQAEGFSVEFAIQQRRGPLENPVVPHVAVPAGLVGQECAVTVTTGNNHSVHDTDVVVRSNGDEVTVRDIESAPNLTRTATDLLSVREGIGVIVIAHDDGATSISGTVSLECKEPPSSTTTTSASTPPSSTTSIPSTNTTTPNPSTSTSVPGSSSSTTSTTPETSSTTAPPAPTTTAPTGSSTTPSTLPSELPHTGAVGAGTILGAGFGLLGTGGFTAWRFRKRDA